MTVPASHHPVVARLSFDRAADRQAALQQAKAGGALPGPRESMPDAAPGGATASTPVGTPDQPTLSRRAIVRRAIVLVGLLVFLLGFALPRLVDYDAVRTALAALTPWQLALLVASSIVA